MILTTIAALLLVLFWVSAVGFGGVTVWRGLRGRLVDRLPRCRRCGYLLIGLPIRPTTCAECGAGLLGSRKVRVGRRVRRRWLVAGGVAILLVALGPIALTLLPSRATVAKPALTPAAARQTITLIPSPRTVAIQSEWRSHQNLQRPIPKRETPARGSRRPAGFAWAKVFGVGRLEAPEIEPLVPELVRGRPALPKLLTPAFPSLLKGPDLGGWSLAPAPKRPHRFGAGLPLEPIFTPAGGSRRLLFWKPSRGAIATPPFLWPVKHPLIRPH